MYSSLTWIDVIHNLNFLYCFFEEDVNSDPLSINTQLTIAFKIWILSPKHHHEGSTHLLSFDLRTSRYWNMSELFCWWKQPSLAFYMQPSLLRVGFLVGCRSSFSSVNSYLLALPFFSKGFSFLAFSFTNSQQYPWSSSSSMWTQSIRQL